MQEWKTVLIVFQDGISVAAMISYSLSQDRKILKFLYFADKLCNCNCSMFCCTLLMSILVLQSS